MGRKVSDGMAINLTMPAYAGTIADGELVRVGKINGCIVGEVTETEVNRQKACEAAHDFIHEIAVPSGVNPAVGTWLYWATPASFQYGPVHLQATAATAGDAPCFFVTGAKANGYIRGRVLNGVTGDADVS